MTLIVIAGNHASRKYGIIHELDGKPALPQVNQWLESCLAGHKQCSGHRGDFLPTRLIFVGDAVPRLVLLSNIEVSEVCYPKPLCKLSLIPFPSIPKGSAG